MVYILLSDIKVLKGIGAGINGTKIICHVNQVEKTFVATNAMFFVGKRKTLAGNRVDKHRLPIIVDRYSIKTFFENIKR